MDGAPLLLCFPFVRETVFELLTLGDTVLLLSSCRTLREDRDAVALALRFNRVTCHFGRRCTRDWLLTEPPFDVDDECYDDHEAAPLWGSPESSVSLLSLVGLLDSKFGDVWYEATRSSNTVPFILPARVKRGVSDGELRAALNALSDNERLRQDDIEVVDHDGVGLGSILFPEVEEDGDPTPLISPPGLHWENLAIDSVGEDPNEETTVVCRFCESMHYEINKFVAEADAFCTHRARLMEDLQGSGEDPNSDAFRNAMADYDQQMRSLHVFYDQRELERPPNEIAFILFLTDRFQQLELMSPKTAALATCVAQAVEEEYILDLCPVVYRPLCRIFSTNSFTHIRRVKTGLDDTQADERPTINSVEMVGGLAPHGYYAGVFLTQTSPW